MDSIPGFSIVFQNWKGIFIPALWISHHRPGRNRHGSAGSTFFSLEEGSNFVQNSRQIK